MHFLKILFPLCLLTACISYPQSPQLLTSEVLKIEPLTSGVFVHISYLESPQFGHVPCNGMVYVRGKEAVIFDTPIDSASSEKLIEWVEKGLEKRIKAVVINHFHDDCLGGLEVFHAHGIASYAHQLTIDLARETGKTSLPQNGFEQSLTLKCGGGTIENRYFGEGHTRDNIVSYLPAEKALFGGCLIKSLNAGKGYLGDANTAEWPATVDKIKQTYPEIKFVVPGHGAAGNVELLDFTAKLFREEK
ncbi:MAG: subclass B1 metallo-beta-lactamase [Bacteroidia bacterium]|nr:subclass B1 metallo-beta-lactamase [Bacteroidia bacterium]